MAAGLQQESLEKFYLNFASDKKNLLALNTCVKYGPEEILHSRTHHELTNHLFNHKVCMLSIGLFYYIIRTVIGKRIDLIGIYLIIIIQVCTHRAPTILAHPDILCFPKVSKKLP